MKKKAPKKKTKKAKTPTPKFNLRNSAYVIGLIAIAVGLMFEENFKNPKENEHTKTK